MHYCSEALKRDYKSEDITQAETTTPSENLIGLLQDDHKVLHCNSFSMPTCDKKR